MGERIIQWMLRVFAVIGLLCLLALLVPTNPLGFRPGYFCMAAVVIVLIVLIELRKI